MIDSANAVELAQIASEVGADIPSSNLRYAPETDRWRPYGTMPKSTLNLVLEALV